MEREGNVKKDMRGEKRRDIEERKVKVDKI